MFQRWNTCKLLFFTQHDNTVLAQQVIFELNAYAENNPGQCMVYLSLHMLCPMFIVQVFFSLFIDTLPNPYDYQTYPIVQRTYALNSKYMSTVY